MKDHPSLDAIDAAIARKEPELNKSRQSRADAELATAAAIVRGERSEAARNAEETIRRLEGELRSLRYLRTYVGFDKLDADVARREHHYAAEVERCSTLRTRSANRELREVSAGAGEAWRAAERGRKHNLDEAFAAYEVLNLWLLSERREIDALIEERDALSRALAAILRH